MAEQQSWDGKSERRKAPFNYELPECKANCNDHPSSMLRLESLTQQVGEMGETKKEVTKLTSRVGLLLYLMIAVLGLVGTGVMYTFNAYGTFRDNYVRDERHRALQYAEDRAEDKQTFIDVIGEINEENHRYRLRFQSDLNSNFNELDDRLDETDRKLATIEAKLEK